MAGTDTIIFFSIVTFLLITGFVMPTIQRDLAPSTQVGASDTDNIRTTTQNANMTVSDFDDVGFLSFIPSVIGAFTWSGGYIPVWIEILLFIPLRLLMVYLGIRLVRGV